MTHIAAIPITVGPLMRQLCGWCGHELIDYDLRLVGVEVRPGEEPQRPATFPVNELIRFDGPARYPIPHEDGADLPVDCCASLSLDVAGVPRRSAS